LNDARGRDGDALQHGCSFRCRCGRTHRVARAVARGTAGGGPAL